MEARDGKGVGAGQIPGACTPHDAVQTAIEKFLDGKRQWNWGKSAYDNLKGSVSSEISNWGTSAENTRTSLIGDDEKVIQLPTPQPGPEHQAIDTIEDALPDALNAITPDDARAWFRHCEYRSS